MSKGKTDTKFVKEPDTKIVKEETKGPVEAVPIDILLDEQLINSLKKDYETKTQELRGKLYPIKISEKAYNYFKDFMDKKSEWKAKESLGVVEVANRLRKIFKDGGIKDGVIYMTNLEIEASHYFLSKYVSHGYEDALSFIDLFKSIETALTAIQPDNNSLKSIEHRLKAAMQGISPEEVKKS